MYPERPFFPDYLPVNVFFNLHLECLKFSKAFGNAEVDEDHPVKPQDPYAMSKYFGELLMDAAVFHTPLHLFGT